MEIFLIIEKCVLTEKLIKVHLEFIVSTYKYHHCTLIVPLILNKEFP